MNAFHWSFLAGALILGLGLVGSGLFLVAVSFLPPAPAEDDADMLRIDRAARGVGALCTALGLALMLNALQGA